MELILTSTVVAALISTIIGFFQNRKTENLQYITNEKAKWREKIREIFKDISKSQNSDDLYQALAELKTRINPYGKYIDNLNKDSHIWETIENIEKVDTNDKFHLYKKTLIDYLSLLLKRDWEISKNEIKSNLYRNLILILPNVL